MHCKISKLNVLDRISKSNKRLRAKLQLKKAVCNWLLSAVATKTNQATDKREQKAKSLRPTYDKK